MEVLETDLLRDDLAALAAGFGGGGPPPDPGAGAEALARDPLIGPTRLPVEHHPGNLLQVGYRQYDQQLINAGFQPPPPPPPPGAGAVAAVPAQGYMRNLAADVAAGGAQMGAAQAVGHVAQGLVARAMASAPVALAGAPLYAGALNLVAGAAVGVAAGAAGNVVRRSLGGGSGPPPDAGAAAFASAPVLPGGLGVAEVRQIFEPPQRPTPLERQFVVKGAPRDGAAVAAMQRQHDLAGGSAPHLDFRSLNGKNDG